MVVPATLSLLVTAVFFLRRSADSAVLAARSLTGQDADCRPSVHTPWAYAHGPTLRITSPDRRMMMILSSGDQRRFHQLFRNTDTVILHFLRKKKKKKIRFRR